MNLHFVFVNIAILCYGAAVDCTCEWSPWSTGDQCYWYASFCMHGSHRRCICDDHEYTSISCGSGEDMDYIRNKVGPKPCRIAHCEPVSVWCQWGYWSNWSPSCGEAARRQRRRRCCNFTSPPMSVYGAGGCLQNHGTGLQRTDLETQTGVRRCEAKDKSFNYSAILVGLTTPAVVILVVYFYVRKRRVMLANSREIRLAYHPPCPALASSILNPSASNTRQQCYDDVASVAQPPYTNQDISGPTAPPSTPPPSYYTICPDAK